MRQLTSLQHPLVKHLCRLRDKRTYRYEQRSIVIEGHKMISELDSSHHILTLLVSDASLIPQHIKADDVIIVSPEILKKIAASDSPEGIVAEVTMPTKSLLDLQGKSRIVVCDGIADPGNLGTLIRTALALGWEAVYLLENCCDPFNDKALRAAKGGTFRLPIVQGNWEEVSSIAKNEGWKLLVADVKGIVPEKFENENKVLLILGNESHGPSQAVKKECVAVSIPMPGPMESLNVSMAGAILMYVLGKK